MADDAARADMTSVLKAWTSGRTDAVDRFTPLVRAPLNWPGRTYLRRARANHTLQVVTRRLRPR